MPLTDREVLFTWNDEPSTSKISVLYQVRFRIGSKGGPFMLMAYSIQSPFLTPTEASPQINVGKAMSETKKMLTKIKAENVFILHQILERLRGFKAIFVKKS
jgi:hypothetical protein